MSQAFSIRDYDAQIAEELALSADIPQLLAVLLAQRGISDAEQAQAFLKPSLMQLSARVKPTVGGLVIRFDQDTAIPARKRTPAGLQYTAYTLKVFKNHMDPGPLHSIDEIKHLTKK